MNRILAILIVTSIKLIGWLHIAAGIIAVFAGAKWYAVPCVVLGIVFLYMGENMRLLLSRTIDKE